MQVLFWDYKEFSFGQYFLLQQNSYYSIHRNVFSVTLVKNLSCRWQQFFPPFSKRSSVRNVCCEDMPSALGSLQAGWQTTLARGQRGNPKSQFLTGEWPICEPQGEAFILKWSARSLIFLFPLRDNQHLNPSQDSGQLQQQKQQVGIQLQQGGAQPANKILLGPHQVHLHFSHDLKLFCGGDQGLVEACTHALVSADGSRKDLAFVHPFSTSSKDSDQTRTPPGKAPASSSFECSLSPCNVPTWGTQKVLGNKIDIYIQSFNTQLIQANYMLGFLIKEGVTWSAWLYWWAKKLSPWHFIDSL